MPIKSYLAHPHDGKKEQLLQDLSIIQECEVLPAENRDILILVTDTKDDHSEVELEKKLKTIKSLKLLAMVSGFNSKQN
ncbi:hypothetical protein [Spongiivirga citrea]|uniref:Uncharacterized protein n=1 Tax=Spongiivirga citrea TaxID=1481457 RepID=A0A6M0CNN3_9FLAO|nr:hypothetical protein [Spongiivirga citrea]NER17469.1 hypothetical protein [Spongiivirga citrea]